MLAVAAATTAAAVVGTIAHDDAGASAAAAAAAAAAAVVVAAAALLNCMVCRRVGESDAGAIVAGVWPRVEELCGTLLAADAPQGTASAPTAVDAATTSASSR